MLRDAKKRITEYPRASLNIIYTNSFALPIDRCSLALELMTNINIMPTASDIYAWRGTIQSFIFYPLSENVHLHLIRDAFRAF